MTESEIWNRLEYRLCKGIAGLKELQFRGIWCDEFIPLDYLFDAAVPCIKGRVWICKGDEQVEWTFLLLLPAHIRSIESINWNELLPPDDTTRWLSIDEHTQQVEIDSGAAIPDSG